MAANRYTNFVGQKYVDNFVPAPFAEIAQVGAMRQQAQDAALTDLATIETGVKSIHALPGDQIYANNAVKDISTNIESFASRDFNDPSVRNEWNKQKASIAQRFSPTGDLGMIDNNYTLGMAWKKDILDKSKESGWGSSQLEGFTNEGLKSHQTVGTDGSVNMFEGQGVYNRVDYNKWISDALKDVAADTDNVGLSRYSSLDEVNTAFQHGEIEHKDYAKIMNALALRAQGDPALVQSLEQEGQFMGQTGWGQFVTGYDADGNLTVDANNPFGAILAGASAGASYTKQNMDYNIVGDPLAEYRGKKSIDNESSTVPYVLPGQILGSAADADKYKVTLTGDNIDSGISILTNLVAAPDFLLESQGVTKQQILSKIKQLQTLKDNPSVKDDALLSEPQKIILKVAEDQYGESPATISGKAQLINKYLDNYGTQEFNIGINQYTDPKIVKQDNQIYFGTDVNGANAAQNLSFRLIAGDGKEVGTGKDILADYGNNKDYNVNITGTLDPSNPYYSSGRVVTITDKSGEHVATYAMQVPMADLQDQYNADLQHDIYQVKYTPTNQKIVEDANGALYQVRYQMGTDPNALDDQGRPIANGVDNLYVAPVDKNGQLLFPSKPETKFSGPTAFQDFYLTLPDSK